MSGINHMIKGGKPEPILQCPVTIVACSRVGLSATATFQLTSAGDIFASLNDGTNNTSDQGDWINPKSAAGGNYEVTYVVNSGSFTSEPGSSFVLSANATWTIIRPSLGSNNVNMTLTIQKISNPAIFVTVGVDLTATRT